MAHGASAAELRSVLKETEGTKYPAIVARALMYLGPQGGTTNEIITKANHLQLEGGPFNEASDSVKSGVSKSSHKPWCAFIGARKYSLKCFPSVVEQPRPATTRKKKTPTTPDPKQAQQQSELAEEEDVVITEEKADDDNDN